MILNKDKIALLESRLNYKFADLELLRLAFTHPSAETAEKGNYQRLEFLGDQVVGLAVSLLLYRTFPEAEEGALSKARSNLIDERALAFNSKNLNLGDLMILGKGEEKMFGRDKESILSDIFESLMAVIFIEAGWLTVFRIIDEIFTPLIDASPDISDLLVHINRDYKTKLQEIAQELVLQLPRYNLTEKRGPEHDSVFLVECSAMGYSAVGVGKNKKSAEQNAAMKILQEMRIIGS